MLHAGPPSHARQKRGTGGEARRRPAWQFGLILALFAVLAGQPTSAGLAAAEEPAIVAANAVVIAEPGQVILFDRAMDEAVPPASLTKIMTAHIALRRADLGQRLTVHPSDLVGQASMGLQAGDTLTLEALLFGLLLPSGNDAAVTIARELGARDGGGSPEEAVARFVGWMNDEAARLGLRQTHFVNPHGLDRPGHLSSAADLARLTLEAARDPRFVRLAGRPTAMAGGRSLRHGHALIGRDPRVLAGKTGRTRGCRSCLMTLAERDGRRIVIIVLRSTPQAVVDDTTTLLALGFSQPLVTRTPTATPPPATPTPTAVSTPTPSPTASPPSLPTPTTGPPPSATPQPSLPATAEPPASPSAVGSPASPAGSATPPPRGQPPAGGDGGQTEPTALGSGWLLAPAVAGLTAGLLGWRRTRRDR